MNITHLFTPRHSEPRCRDATPKPSPLIRLWRKLVRPAGKATNFLLICAPIYIPQVTANSFPTYTITSITTNSAFFDINDRGDIVGTTWIDDRTLKAWIRENGTIIELPGLPGRPRAHPRGLSAEGVIVGGCAGGGARAVATLWRRTGESTFDVIDLNSLAESGDDLVLAEAISSDARFVGIARAQLESVAVMEFDLTGRFVKIHELSPGPGTLITSVQSTTAGFIATGSALGRTVLWRSEASGNLTFGPPGSGGFSLNSRGEIVGSTGDRRRPFYWDENQQAIDIFAGQSLAEGRATGINDAGYVVGATAAVANNSAGFIWHRALGMKTLASLISSTDRSGVTRVSFAVRINNKGQILAGQNFADGRSRSFVMNPQHLPVLKIERNEESVVISWDAATLGFELQLADTISGTWNRVPAEPVMLDDQALIVMPALKSSSFFRLARP